MIIIHIILVCRRKPGVKTYTCMGRTCELYKDPRSGEDHVTCLLLRPPLLRSVGFLDLRCLPWMLEYSYSDFEMIWRCRGWHFLTCLNLRTGLQDSSSHTKPCRPLLDAAHRPITNLWEKEEEQRPLITLLCIIALLGLKQLHLFQLLIFAWQHQKN